MKKEIADMWVTALRSDKYVQGHSYLRTADNKFCCLGVLGDLLQPNNWRELDGNDSCYYLNEADAILPESVKEEAGMQSCTGELPLQAHNGYSGALWQFNDTEKYSFDQIADVIEQNWEQL